VSTEVYIAFTKAKSTIARFLHPEISHCFAFWYQDGVWVAFDKNIDRDDIFISKEINDIIAESLVVRVPVKEMPGRLIGINTCVSAVKRRIGLKDWKIQTPYQLFKRLSNGIT